ncbi:hypothetical protein D3C85_554250 [compost metagenome]
MTLSQLAGERLVNVQVCLSWDAFCEACTQLFVALCGLFLYPTFLPARGVVDQFIITIIHNRIIGAAVFSSHSQVCPLVHIFYQGCLRRTAGRCGFVDSPGDKVWTEDIVHVAELIINELTGFC